MNFPKQHMQPHLRIAIRHKIKQLMIDNVDIGGRVYLSRPHPAWLSQVPLLLIYFSDEECDDRESSPRIYKKTPNIIIEILQRQENDVDDYLDSRAFEIEHVMEMEPFLGFEFVDDVKQRRSICTSITHEGNEMIASLKIYFEIDYYFEPFNTVTIDEFLSFTNKIETTEGAFAEDDVTIRSG